MVERTVEVAMKPNLLDAEGAGISRDIADMGISTPVRVRVSQVYWLQGDLEDTAIRDLASRLLVDAVAQDVAFEGDLILAEPGETGWIAEICLKPGVTDAVGSSVLKGARDLGLQGLQRVATGRKVYLFGELRTEDATRICQRHLVNDVIQRVTLRPVGDTISV